MFNLWEYLPFSDNLDFKKARSILLGQFVVSLLQGGIISLILYSATDEISSERWYILGGLVALIALFIYVKAKYTGLGFSLIEEAANDFRLHWLKQYRQCQLFELEKFDLSTVVTSITRDMQILILFMSSVFSLLLTAFLILFCFVYIGFLSFSFFCYMNLLLLCVLLLLVSDLKNYQKLVRIDNFYQSRLGLVFENVISGLKELKFRLPLKNHVEHVSNSLIDKASQYRIRFSRLFHEHVFYLNIGFLSLLAIATFSGQQDQGLFWTIEEGSRSKLIFVLFFIYMNTQTLLVFFPNLHKFRQSLHNLRNLESKFHHLQKEIGEPEAEVQRLDFGGSLCVDGITFAYDDAREFGLGPVDFELKKGEIVFLTGGNGSGKSTFMKLLCGLYTPIQGGLKLDGQYVNHKNIAAFRGLFSAVLSEYHIFENLCHFGPSEQEEIRALLQRFGLSYKVEIEKGFLTNTELSQGERKRLALVFALFKDSEVLLLDEWAKEQDLGFKDYFYKELLAELKNKGKTVVAATHDDDYFSYADRIVHFSEGRIDSAVPSP